MIDVYTFCDNRPMETMGDRLRWARKIHAGIPSARRAAKEVLKIEPSTYTAHENGQNEFDPIDAKKYAKAFKVDSGWLLTGDGDPIPPPPLGPHGRPLVRLVGYVSAGTQTFFPPDEELGEVEAPADASLDTVAVEVRGDSLGTAFNGWLVFYDNVQRPITQDMYGKLCVIGLESGEILIKEVRPSKRRGLYHLFPQSGGEPILDAKIEWAARVKHMVAR